MKKIKIIIKKIIISFSRLLSKTRIGLLIEEILINNVMKHEKTVIHDNKKMRFSVPNRLNYFRVDTFSSKEPETLEWIDSFSDKSVLWDIGANIGLYSVYAAKKKNCRVFSFEPSVFNLELLARNIFLNDLQKKITIIPLALSHKMGFNNLRLTSTEWGGALSTFGKDFGWDGKPIQDIFSFSTFGFSLDQAASMLNLHQPDYIKLDVDGIEHAILKGGKNVLEKTKSILVEINDNFEEQSEKSKHFLSNAGLVLDKKLHSELIENSSGDFVNTYNQIWVRKPHV